jgi:hypothetical protein
MILDDAKFALIEQKIDEIRWKIDKGIMNPGVRGDLACEQLRAARAELFRLRELLHTSIELDPTCGPDHGSEVA